MKLMGVFSGSSRTPDQSELALFWQLNTPLAWDRIAAQISTQRGLSFVENAHLFALLNVTMADAAIACWDSKYRYVFWRPITAIREAPNPSDGDPAWKPWLDIYPAGTPAFPEYPSGHATVSSSAASVLSSVFGEDTAFTVNSELRPGTRAFPSFTSAIVEISDARVFGGIHFRTSCVLGNAQGKSVADYVSRRALRILYDAQNDSDEDSQ